MKRLKTDFPTATRLLDVIVAAGSGRLACAHRPDWLAGYIVLDFTFSDLSERARMQADAVPTVLAYLHCSGFIELFYPMESSVHIALTLPEGARAA